MIVRSIRLATPLGLAVLLGTAACGDDPPKPPPRPAGAGSPAAAGIDAITGGAPAAPPAGSADDQAAAATVTPDPADGEQEDSSDVPYAYSPIGKRDPFRNLFEVDDAQDTEELTELQKYELDQLKLVAVVSRIATPYAMVEDPSGKGHTLTRGTLIGKNWGQVAQIRPDCVVVREEYRDYTGRKVTNRTSLCLPKPEELKVD
jgi:type IV pilus assembly protein PilP